MKFTPRLLLSLLVVGILAGFIGIGLSWLLHFVQHQAYGYDLSGIEEMPFRVGVEAAPGWRRVAVLSLCGVLAGVGWYIIKRRGAPLVSIKASLDNPRKGLPFSPPSSIRCCKSSPSAWARRWDAKWLRAK